MHTVEIGGLAEQAAADFIEQEGYRIIGRNWRQRRCEIDIIATRGHIVYFFEVKYRRRSYAGSGFEYVTDKKQRQMAFAADIWLAFHHWHGPYQLGAVEVSGPRYTVTGFIESIS